MKFVFIGVVLAVALGARVYVERRRRARKAVAAGDNVTTPPASKAERRSGRWSIVLSRALGDAGLVAAREIRERIRGRIFRIGTLIILLAVGAAIIIPAVHKGSSPSAQKVALVGSDAASMQPLVEEAAAGARTKVDLVSEDSLTTATNALRAGTVDVVVDGNSRVMVNNPLDSDSTSSATATLAQSLAAALGIEQAYRAAALTPEQIGELSQAKPVPVQSLQPHTKSTVKTTSVIGLVLLFLMLTQYNTWIMTGVMQEKASRVVEVLLAAVRPLQLLGGKVLGIGLVAMGQAALIVAFALVVAAAVGSDILHGTAPLVLASELLWLVLGYAFYCWVYAAAGSMAERQDQVQTLALPLTLPIVVAYVLAITAASTGSASVFFEVLAYLPPTAPFAMPVLVGLGLVSWWQFVLSVVLALAGTVGVALLAERIYRRAVLRSGQRVRLHDLRDRRKVRPGPAAG
jgi:ABC-2 type transport system permease protein